MEELELISKMASQKEIRMLEDKNEIKMGRDTVVLKDLPAITFDKRLDKTIRKEINFVNFVIRIKSSKSR